MNLLLRKDNKQRANQLATRAIFKAAKRTKVVQKNKDTKYKNKSQKQSVQYLFLKIIMNKDEDHE